MDRPNKPTALARTPTLPPQAQVEHNGSRVSALLPTGESVEVLLHGATVISWKTAAGEERLWLSDAAKLDGTKPVRGGIPLVFPVFGSAPDHEATSKLPQHGFARNSTWEFLGKSTSEGDESSSVKLDFGLSSSSLDEKTRALWDYKFGLLYSVSLNRTSLSTTIVITNEDDKAFDCQVLLHTYLRVQDINAVEIKGLEGAEFLDKVDGKQVKTQQAGLRFARETDSVYHPVNGSQGTISISEDSRGEVFKLSRDNLDDVVVWNPWTEKAAGMGDFEPKTGWQQMVCVEAGSVKTWQKLEPGDAFTGAQVLASE